MLDRVHYDFPHDMVRWNVNVIGKFTVKILLHLSSFVGDAPSSSNVCGLLFGGLLPL